MMVAGSSSLAILLYQAMEDQQNGREGHSRNLCWGCSVTAALGVGWRTTYTPEKVVFRIIGKCAKGVCSFFGSDSYKGIFVQFYERTIWFRESRVDFGKGTGWFSDGLVREYGIDRISCRRPIG